MIALIISIATFFVYAKTSKYDLEGIVPPVESSTQDEQLLLHSNIDVNSSSSRPIDDANISFRSNVGYRIALCLVFALHFIAVCGILNAPLFVQRIATTTVLTCLFGIRYLPFSSSLRVFPISSETPM